METEIRKVVKAKTMNEVFDRVDMINIRYFKAIDTSDEVDENKNYTYLIRIRHNEEENAKVIFNRAVKSCEKYKEI